MFSSVLIVDPDPDAAALYTRLLRDCDSIEYAIDGRDGLFKLLAHPPDLLVTEARLPLLNGCDLCTIARRELTPPILSIVATTLTDLVIDQRAHACGADIVVAKPLDEGVVRAAFECLRGHAAVVRAQSRRIRRDARLIAGRSRVIQAQHRAIWRKLPQ